MNNTEINRPLRWFAALTAIATFFLLGAGGLVTSHEAGMSVPDWASGSAASVSSTATVSSRAASASSRSFLQRGCGWPIRAAG